MGKINSCCISRNQASSIYQELKFNEDLTPYVSILEEHKEPYFPLRSELLNQYQQNAGFEFTFENLKQFITDAEYSLDGFDHIVSKKEYQVYVRPGSPYNPQCPEQKLFVNFDSTIYTAQDILQIISNIGLQAQWNSQCSKLSLIKKESDILSLVHEVVAAPFPHVPRDFVLKVIRFKEEDAYYCYYSSTPDSIKPIEVTKGGKFNYIRGELLLGLQVLRRVNQNWRLFTATQRDMKMMELDYKGYQKYLDRLLKLYHRELRSAIQQYQDHKIAKSKR